MESKSPSINRGSYWNKEYYQYWLARTREANTTPGTSGFFCGDKANVGNAVAEGLVRDLNVNEGDVALDVGCGFGRLLPYLLARTHKVFAADISQAMIEEAKSVFDKQVIFRVEAVENCSFDDDTFDRIICFGVFDATIQNHALLQLLRVLKPEGTLLLTGKNSDYACDDAAALLAEENARKKGHPNFFTDYRALRHQLTTKGARFVKERFYLRRGDFGDDRFETQMPPRFYEYCAYLSKANYDGSPFSQFSTERSRTHTEQGPAV